MGEHARWARVGGALAGAMVGGVVGLVTGSFSVFGWEWWVTPVFLLAASAGGFAGALVERLGVLSATVAAAVPFGGLFDFIAVKASVDDQLPPDDSWGIPIWGTVSVVTAGFLAASIVSVGTRAVSGRAPL